MRQQIKELNHEKNNIGIFIYSSFILSALAVINICIMSSPNYVSLKDVDAFWSHENEVVFEGMTYANELYSVSIPIHEITDSLDYIIEKRIEYITLRKKELLSEQRILKSKLKKWKSLNL